MATLTNILTQYTEAQLENAVITELETELGIQLISFLETPLPVWPFIALGYAVYDIINLFSGGKPVTVDTDNVIKAYNMSAYWPLHALAADLQEMLKNGAPISDSNPVIQAQFGQLKQGTVESIQALAGAQQGASGDGYWQIFNLIELTWQYAGNYNVVFDLVKAIDQFTIGLSQLVMQNQGGGGGGGGGGGTPTPTPPSPVPGPCPPYTAIPTCLPQPSAPNPALDEIGQNFAGVAYWLQILAIYAMNLFQKAPTGTATPPGTTDPVTCTQLTGLFDQLISAIAGFTVTVPTPTSPDLTPIVTALEAIAAALGALPTPPAGQPPDLSILNAQAQSELDARNALAAALLDVDADIQAQAAQYGNQL